MEQSMQQASNFLSWTSFHTLFLLANVLTTSTCLHVSPTGWYVDDRNRALPIRFQCFNEGGARVTWRFKGKDLSASSPCNRGATRTVCGPLLLILKFQDDYAGLYTCRDPLSREVHVQLGVQPEFVDSHETDYIAAVGERVDLDCSTRPNVYPSASVVWKKQEGGILKTMGTGEKLTIEKTGLNDSGTYICKATNNQKKPLGTRSKHVVLYVYVPASCKFVSAKHIANNVSVTVELLGRPQPQFSAAQPWHKLASDAIGRAVITRSRGFSESSPQLVGLLTQVVTSGRKMEKLLKPCNPQIAIPPSRLQICLFIRLTPKNRFCAKQSSFNNQAKKMIEELLVNLHVNNFECHYEGDIRAVFVEKGGKCPPFRVVVTIRSEINATFHCHNSSKVYSWLSTWNSNFGALEIYKNANGDEIMNLTNCSKDIEKAPHHSIEECHRVFYCSKLPNKDRTVCFVKGYFRRRVTQIEQNFELSMKSKKPRLLCLVAF